MEMADVIMLRGSKFVIDNCITCGVVFAVAEERWDHARAEGGYFYCSNGHSQGWSKERSEHENLRRERDRLKQSIAQRDDEIERQILMRKQAEGKLSATKAKIVKIKKRVSHGVCPCCSRTFENLARHMTSKHPTFTAEAAE